MMLAPIVPKRLGRCPSCHALGAVGEACIERVCKMREYAFIPFEDGPGKAEQAEDDPLIGQRCDDYLLVSLIGAGGFGRVYRALQLPLQRPTAVKLLPLESGPMATTPELRRCPSCR
jgi:hypothetical protein